MSKTIRIGTRDSELALWQAHTVQKKTQRFRIQNRNHRRKITG